MVLLSRYHAPFSTGSFANPFLGHAFPFLFPRNFCYFQLRQSRLTLLFVICSPSVTQACVIFGAITLFGFLSWYFTPAENWLRREQFLQAVWVFYSELIPIICSVSLTRRKDLLQTPTHLEILWIPRDRTPAKILLSKILPTSINVWINPHLFPVQRVWRNCSRLPFLTDKLMMCSWSIASSTNLVHLTDAIEFMWLLQFLSMAFYRIWMSFPLSECFPLKHCLCQFPENPNPYYWRNLLPWGLRIRVKLWEADLRYAFGGFLTRKIQGLLFSQVPRLVDPIHLAFLSFSPAYIRQHMVLVL